MKENADKISFYTSANAMHDALDHDLDQEQYNIQQRLNNLLAQMDPMEDRIISGQLDRIERDEDLSPSLVREFDSIVAIAMCITTKHNPQCTVRTTHQTPNLTTKWKHRDTVWQPCPLEMDHTKFFFGYYFIRLITKCVQRVPAQDPGCPSKEDIVVYDVRMTWRYHHLRCILYDTCPGYIVLALKFVQDPEFEIKAPDGSWQSCIPPPPLQFMSNNGKLGIWLSSGVVDENDLQKLLREWRYFTQEHHITWHEYKCLETAYCKAEQSAANSAFTSRKGPAMGNHADLCKSIAKLMDAQRTGGTIECHSCHGKFGWFQSHAICIPSQLDCETVTKHIFDRLQCGSDGDSELIVDFVSDPNKHPRSAATAISEDPNLYGTFVKQIFVSFCSWIQQDRRPLFLNCRQDDDWAALNCPLYKFIALVDEAISKTLQEHKRVLPTYKYDRRVLEKWLCTISDLFILPYEYQRHISRHFESTEAVCRVFGADECAVRLKNHYHPDRICDPHIIANIIAKYDCQIMRQEYVWSFWNYYKES